MRSAAKCAAPFHLIHRAMLEFTNLFQNTSGLRASRLLVTLAGLAIVLGSCGKPSSNEGLETVTEVSTSAPHSQPRSFRLHNDSRLWLAGQDGRIGTFTRVGGKLNTIGNRVIGNGTRFSFDPDSFESENESIETAIRGLKDEADGRHPHFQLERIINEEGQLQLLGMLQFGAQSISVAGPVESVRVTEKSAVLIGQAPVSINQLPFLKDANLEPDSTLQIQFKIHAVPSAAAEERRKLDPPEPGS